MTNLKCPFCGRKKVKYMADTIYGENDLRYFYFECKTCHMQFLVEEQMARDIGAISKKKARKS